MKGGGTTKRNKRPAAVKERQEHHFTSGDLARLLHVDLKTIHNWVNNGYITGRRTQGRHLRFDRTEVVRFMRTYGYSMTEAISGAPPRMALVANSKATDNVLRALRRNVELSVCDDLFAAALAVAAGDIELLVVDLDHSDKKAVSRLVVALRQWEATKGLVLLGLSASPRARTTFLKEGGDGVLPLRNVAELKNVARWFSGAQGDRPSVLVLADK